MPAASACEHLSGSGQKLGAFSRQNKSRCLITGLVTFGTKAALFAGQFFLQPCNRSI